jgi:maltose alpha-D-glucosyltransferase / alpha-amylase
MKRIILLLIILLTGISVSARKHPEWLKKAVFYQIYPSSFQDNDGNGIGDIKGVLSRLDYIQSIGINTIWFNPLFTSAWQDGGYDVIDYYQVDPRFGTNSELVEFINEVHKRGMHITLDLVAGHSSDQSEWFKQSMEADNNQRYSDYYIWAPVKPDNLARQEASAWVEKNAPRAKYYIKNFYNSQPALNYGYANPNPDRPWEQSVNAPGPQAVRRELQNIITFWMEKGVDGFRVDMAASLIKNDPDKSATIALWKTLSSWFEEKFPQGVLIAEWFNPKQAIEGGFDIDFLLSGNLFSSRGRGAQTPGSVYFDKTGAGDFAGWYKSYIDQYENTVGKGYVSVPTGNHDNPRIATTARGDGPQLKVAMTFFLTLPGVPFIYYGDEIGLKFIPNLPAVEGSNVRSGERTPMQWDNTLNAGFSSAPKEKIYIPQDPDPNRPTVANQDKDPNSLLNFVRAMIAFRASSDALGSDGEFKMLGDITKPYPLIYMRTKGSEKYIIGLNPSDKIVEAEIETLNSDHIKYVFGTNIKCSYKPGKTVDKIKLPALSAVIFKME